MRSEPGRAPGGQSRPLASVRVLVTRRSDQAGGLSEQLRRYGAEVLELPLIRIGPPGDLAAARRSIVEMATYDYVVFTSVNAVAAVATMAAQAGLNLPVPGPRVFAVGPTTAKAARAAGLRCEELPEQFNSAGVADQLRKHSLAGGRVLLPRSEIGRPELPAMLRGEGALVDDIAFYTTSPDPEAATRLPEVMADLDVVTFASGSAVAAFRAALPAGWGRPNALVVAVIGPDTAAAAEAAGLEPDVVAAEHTAGGLASAVAAYFVRS